MFDALNKTDVPVFTFPDPPTPEHELANHLVWLVSTYAAAVVRDLEESKTPDLGKLKEVVALAEECIAFGRKNNALPTVAGK